MNCYTVVMNPNQTPTASAEATDKDHKRIRFVGIALIVLSLLNAIFMAIQEPARRTTVGLDYASNLQYIFPLVQILVSVGLLKYNKVAYVAFNVIAGLSVLLGLIGFTFGVFGALLALAMTPAVDIKAILFIIAAVLFQLLPLSLFAYGLVVLHPKRVRLLFR